MATKKAKRPAKGIIIAVIAIVLAIAIALVVIYFASPATWDLLVSYVTGTYDDKSDGNGGANLQNGDGDLVINFLDVGQGDCIYIQFPDGKEMVIDCANYNNTSAIRTEALAYLSARVSDNQIDYLMLTHCDSDHVYFLDDVVNTFDIDNIYMPNVKATDAKVASSAVTAEQLALFTDKDTVATGCYADFFISALTEPDCNVFLNEDPDDSTNSIVITTSTYDLTFFCPTDAYYESTNLSTAEKKNAISPIGVLTYNNRRIVLTGDSNEINEPTFISRAKAKYGTSTLDCDVLKVGHHGSETSSTAAFLDYITCENAVISCNADGNTFSHPRQNTLDRLLAHNMTIYRTDLQGDIVLKVDKDGTITFTTEKTATADQLADGWTDAEIADKTK